MRQGILNFEYRRSDLSSVSRRSDMSSNFVPVVIMASAIRWESSGAAADVAQATIFESLRRGLSSRKRVYPGPSAPASHRRTATCDRILFSEPSDRRQSQSAERASSLIVSRSRTEIEAEPQTRSSAALAAALFSASANDSGDAASGDFGTSRMT